MVETPAGGSRGREITSGMRRSLLPLGREGKSGCNGLCLFLLGKNFQSFYLVAYVLFVTWEARASGERVRKTMWSGL